MLIDEQTHFWVLDKPSGLAINDDADSLGLVSQFRLELNDVQGETVKAHPVHRLDKGTSGLFLIAKTAKANQALSLAFQNKEVKKNYLAITRPKIGVNAKKKQGWVKGDMEKSRGGSWKLLKSQLKPAQTYFKSVSLGERRRLCWLTPLTGKTHQIRVAMKALSMPIVGDDRYTGEPADRLYLHATSLSFDLFGQSYEYEQLPTSGALFMDLAPALLAELKT